MADDVVELLTELQSLRADGCLSAEEFATAKRMLLAGLDGGSSGPAVVGPSAVAGSAPVSAPASMTPRPTVEAPVVPAEPTASSNGGGIRLTAPVLAAVVAVLIVAVGLVAVIVSSQPGSSGDVVDDGGTAQPSAVAGGPVTEGEATAFVENYYSLLPDNTSTAFASLSPSLQLQSGGFEEYREFYRSVDSVRVDAPYMSVDGTLNAMIIFTKTNGDTTRESYRFTIARTSGGYVMQAADRS